MSWYLFKIFFKDAHKDKTTKTGDIQHKHISNTMTQMDPKRKCASCSIIFFRLIVFAFDAIFRPSCRRYFDSDINIVRGWCVICISCVVEHWRNIYGMYTMLRQTSAPCYSWIYAHQLLWNREESLKWKY